MRPFPNGAHCLPPATLYQSVHHGGSVKLVERVAAGACIPWRAKPSDLDLFKIANGQPCDLVEHDFAAVLHGAVLSWADDIRSAKVIYQHCVELPLVGKSNAPVQLDPAHGRRLRKHQYVALMFENKRIRQVVGTLEHSARSGPLA